VDSETPLVPADFALRAAGGAEERQRSAFEGPLEEVPAEEAGDLLRLRRRSLVRRLAGRTINLTSSERFTQAFVAINANFAQVFQKLFGGGTASMQLLDESDPLDSGIEIMAQPPGKRNQTIGLLSGGEKALTAVSLLVSIFRYKPSPFCILDEVGAPLDEPNIDRFTALLNELSEETQFDLITHPKRTMETAQALYGVTQGEPGVAKIVSVRFDEKETWDPEAALGGRPLRQPAAQRRIRSRSRLSRSTTPSTCHGR
jgi:chromosome segregation protein